ncbi:putative RNA polymerase II subunit B1 CTD phosphatase RPAP2 [Panonychus citri]|uniref:putative RNA polymerase II subunit B1 CTD phosphatase RPAP2 n=1 Tax=Panonychus citri TaxID=50023 RepID=UPI0023072A46|nr:putative RNA polymerase II subunit B1 CTD phosphatase RPAP2 [Panonychus citri]
MTTVQEKQLKARKIREARRKVLTIVESIVDSKIDQETLIDHCRYLNKQDYHDVNVERSLVNICGYPLCFNDLPKSSRQRYHISLAEHKVYDLSERKLFCSNLCYKASCYLKEQLTDEPFWMRFSEMIGAISSVPLVRVNIYQDTKGARGEEVLVVPRVETDADNLTTGEIETDKEDEFKFHGVEKDKLNQISRKRQQAKLKSTFVASPYIKEKDLTKFAESMSKLTIKERSLDD